MFDIDITNVYENTQTILYIILIVKSLILIFLREFQTTSARRLFLYRLLRFVDFFVLIPFLAIIIGLNLTHILHWEPYVTLQKSYWKVVNIAVAFVSFIIVLIPMNSYVKKGLRFLNKKDRNETKYQAIYTKVRNLLLIMSIADILLLLFLNKISI